MMGNPSSSLPPSSIYVEECFPETPLMPSEPRSRMIVRLLNKLIDEYVHNARTVLTFDIAWYERVRRRPAVERAIMGSMTEAGGGRWKIFLSRDESSE
jgi:glutathione S-transferase